MQRQPSNPKKGWGALVAARSARAETDERGARTETLLMAVLGAELAAFAAAMASGNISDSVLVLFRALLTL